MLYTHNSVSFKCLEILLEIFLEALSHIEQTRTSTEDIPVKVFGQIPSSQ
jgi:hypothetical protein